MSQKNIDALKALCEQHGFTFDDLERQVVYFKDHLDIAIETLCAPIKLSKDQHIIARQAGNCSEIKVVKNRGSGKSFLTALIAHTICVLNPDTPVAVVSGTEMQATIVLKKLRQLADEYPSIRNEIQPVGRTPVVVNDHKGRVVYKNGSSIESYSLNSVRGSRAKILIEDEAPEVNQKDYEAAALPVRKYTRPMCFTYGFEDFPSKEICLTSACEQSNPFYDKFKSTVEKMRKSENAFACALSYEADVYSGLTDITFFEEERRRMPDFTFAMEYGSIFMGSAADTAFPYQLVANCRNLEDVETKQPANSKARYVMAVDIATSEAEGADNTAIAIIKFTERVDYTFTKKLVYLHTMHGKPLDYIAKTVRHLYHDCFPNIEKIVYDARGLGDSFDRFMDADYVDASGIEHPPLITDELTMYNTNGVPVLHPFRAIQQLNQRIYTNLRVALEKRRIELPVLSRIMEQHEMEKKEDERFDMYKRAIFNEVDALAFEMSNIVARVGASGSVLYDVAHQRQHKDRYSAVAMAVDYISELEAVNIRRRMRGAEAIGIATYF